MCRVYIVLCMVSVGQYSIAMDVQDQEKAATELRDITSRSASSERLSPRIQHLRREARSGSGEELGESAMRRCSLTSTTELTLVARPLLGRFLHRHNSSLSLKR